MRFKSPPRHLFSGISYFLPCSCTRTALCFGLLLTTAGETAQTSPSPALDPKPLHPETEFLRCSQHKFASDQQRSFCVPAFCTFLPFVRSHTVGLSKPLCPLFPVYPHKMQTGVSSQSQYKGLCQTVNLDQARCFPYKPQTEHLRTLFLFSLQVTPPAELAHRGRCKG